MLQKQVAQRPKTKVIRFFEYFVTPSGRRLSSYLAGAGALGLACANYLPHTLCVDYYRDFIQHYTFGIPTPVPDYVKRRIYSAADKLNMDDRSKKMIKPFTVSGFDIFGIGSMYSIYGAWIGVPSNFYYKSTEDIDKAKICIRNEPISWNTEHGKMLEQSLVLSESEQMFGFCHTLLDLQSYKLYLKSISPSAILLTIYLSAQNINKGQHLYGRFFLVRYVVYSLLCAFGYGVHSFITDFVNFHHERDIDTTLAALGPDMIEAGLGYYKKHIDRNIAIREIGGMKNEYTAQGNQNFLVRMRGIPLTWRRDFLEAKLKELNEGEEVATAESDKPVESKSSSAKIKELKKGEEIATAESDKPVHRESTSTDQNEKTI